LDRTGERLSGPALLLDAHIDPKVASALRKRGIDAVALRDWREGAFLFASDEVVLRAAAGEARALVTYDVSTIPMLLRLLAESEVDHAGVVFVSHKTIPHRRVGPLVTALAELADRVKETDLINRVLFLGKPARAEDRHYHTSTP
jgi:hypothetical protein